MLTQLLWPQEEQPCSPPKRWKQGKEQRPADAFSQLVETTLEQIEWQIFTNWNKVGVIFPWPDEWYKWNPTPQMAWRELIWIPQPWGVEVTETGNPSREGCFSLKCPALLKCSPPVFSRSLSPSVRRWISISLAEERNPLLVSLLALVQLVHRQQKLLLTVSTGGNSYKPGVNWLAPVQMSRSISPDILLEGSPIWPFLLQSNQPRSGRLVHLKIPYFHL